MYVGGRLEEALKSAEVALECHRLSGDRRREGNALRALRRLLRYMGHPEPALEAGRSAVTVLETITPDRELALAYCNLSYLFMSVEDAENTFSWAAKALVLADQLGDISRAFMRLSTAPRLTIWRANPTRPPRWSAVSRRRVNRFDEYAGRAYVAFCFWAARSKSHADAERWLDDGLNYCTDHGLDLWRSYLVVSRARAELDQGRWDQAVRVCGPDRSRSANLAGHHSDSAGDPGSGTRAARRP